jgi:hypothetical protein
MHEVNRFKTLIFCLVSGALPLLCASGQPVANNHADGVAAIGGAADESDQSGAVSVDVVVDVSPAGKKVAPASPDHPVYYLPMPVGYKEFGYSPHFQRPPPTADQIEHMLAIALNQQGYEVMSHLNHPTQVLYFWWGYMAPPQEDSTQYNQVQPSATGSAAMGGFTSAIGGAEAAVGDASDTQMRQLVGGDTFGSETNPTDPRKQQVLQMIREPRYYILVSAFDFDSWLKNLKETKAGGPVADQPVLLWRAHISTALWGHYFDQVAQTLVTAGRALVWARDPGTAGGHGSARADGPRDSRHPRGQGLCGPARRAGAALSCKRKPNFMKCPSSC